MAAQDDLFGPLLTGIGIIGLFCLCLYLYYRLQKQFMEKKNAIIKLNIRRAENGATAGSDDDFTIVDGTQLMDTRSRDRVENFVQIDHHGAIFVNKKGIHYVGANRRLSWDWNKLMEIRTNQKGETIFGFPMTFIHFRLIVSNRQKISGFKFVGTVEILKIVDAFLQRRLLAAKERIASRTSKGISQQKNSPSTTNITYNIQNVQDSVIQANIDNKQD
jgi:hypothetical protein